MNNIKIKNTVEVKTSTGLQSLENVELKLKTINIDFNDEKSTLRYELYANSDENSLSIKENKDNPGRIELDNSLLQAILTPLVIDVLGNNCVDLNIYNLEWLYPERSIRIFMTWKQASIIAENHIELVQTILANKVPVVELLEGKMLYFEYLDEEGTNVEDLLLSYNIYIQRQ